VPLLITVVLAHIVQVITTHNNRPLHLVGVNDSRKDTTTDRHGGREGTFLVNVVAADGFLGSLVAETNVLVPTEGFGTFGACLFGVLEDAGLLLERAFDLPP
jgi:hypothetical protein